LTIILFTGCSQKNVNIEGKANTKEDASPSAETVIDGTEYIVTDNNDTKNGVKLDTKNDAEELKSTDIDFYNKEITLADGSKEVIKQVYFGFDKFKLSLEMLDRVKSNALIFAKIDSNTKVKLEGYCDEWGTDEYNFALGLKRARSVKEALISEGIDSSKIVLVTFGESDPQCTEKTQACWSINRRVESKLLP
jgi:peptidoglycan-associated lipoprotein